MNGLPYQISSGPLLYIPDKNKIKIKPNQKIAFIQIATKSYHSFYLPLAPPHIGGNTRPRVVMLNDKNGSGAFRFHNFTKYNIHSPFAKSNIQNRYLCYYFFTLGKSVGSKYPLYASNTTEKVIGDAVSVDENVPQDGYRQKKNCPDDT